MTAPLPSRFWTGSCPVPLKTPGVIDLIERVREGGQGLEQIESLRECGPRKAVEVDNGWEEDEELRPSSARNVPNTKP